jgi:prevent-host-death family protein
MTGTADRTPAVRTVGIRELKTRVSEIVREVRASGRPIDITVRGQVVARLGPLPANDALDDDARRQALRTWLDETETFAQEVARRWPSPTSSVELIREQRREVTLGPSAARALGAGCSGVVASGRPARLLIRS